MSAPWRYGKFTGMAPMTTSRKLTILAAVQTAAPAVRESYNVAGTA